VVGHNSIPLDRLTDPVRDDPRFQALVAKYEQQIRSLP
jgi:hypothetical protein